MVLAAVCGFIPVLGSVALWGYYYEIVEALYRQPDAPYPQFDFRRFSAYCTRGVWPYVLMIMVGTIIQFFLQPFLQITLQGGMMLMISNQQAGAIVLAIAAPVILVGLLVLAVGVTVATAPMLLRAGLTQDFRLIFRFDWFQGYWKRVWVEEVLATLFLLAATAVLFPLGCCAFGVGIFAAGVVTWIAASHMQWQIYEIYLERGGEPIPLHPLPAEVPPVGETIPGTPFASADPTVPGPPG